MKLSIVIVNYNSGDFIKECINSLEKNYKKDLGDKNFEIVVVDNNSTDISRDYLEKNKSIAFIENNENLGFSKANNIGIKKTQGNFILFLNPDTVVPENTLNGMLEFMEKNEEAGASSCKLLFANGKEDKDSHRGFPTPWNALTQFSGLSKIFPNFKIFSGYYMGWKDYSKIQEVDSLVGAFMMVRRTAGEEIGWWDEDYFFYGEDIQFCFDLKKKNWKIFYVPTFFIKHFKGVSSGIKKVSQDLSTADKETKKKSTIARFKAMEIFINKNYKQKYNPFLLGVVYFAIKFKLFWALTF